MISTYVGFAHHDCLVDEKLMNCVCAGNFIIIIVGVDSTLFLTF